MLCKVLLRIVFWSSMVTVPAGRVLCTWDHILLNSISNKCKVIPFWTFQERYNELKLKANTSQEHSGRNMFLEKSLSAALDSFDNLFCRRCLVCINLCIYPLWFVSLHPWISFCFGSVFCFYKQVFDCRLHGCSQNLIYPVSLFFFTSLHIALSEIINRLIFFDNWVLQSDKPLGLSESEVRTPCSDQCFLVVCECLNWHAFSSSYHVWRVVPFLLFESCFCNILRDKGEKKTKIK